MRDLDDLGDLIEAGTFPAMPWVLEGAPADAAVPEALRRACAGATYFWLGGRWFPIPRAWDVDPMFGGDVEGRYIRLDSRDSAGGAAPRRDALRDFLNDERRDYLRDYLRVRATAGAWDALARFAAAYAALPPGPLPPGVMPGTRLRYVGVCRVEDGDSGDVLLAEWRLGATRPLRLAPATPAAVAAACARALGLTIVPAVAHGTRQSAADDRPAK